MGARGPAPAPHPPPILRAGVISHLGELPRRGAGLVRRRWGQGMDEVLALPSKVHSHGPFGDPHPPIPGGGQVGLHPETDASS